jgi:intein/homing endonuclease
LSFSKKIDEIYERIRKLNPEEIKVYQYLYYVDVFWRWLEHIGVIDEVLVEGRIPVSAGEKGYVDLWLPAEMACLPPGELLFTDRGLSRIESVNQGEHVFGLTGEAETLRTFKRAYEGQLVEIKPRFFAAVRLTPEHPVLIAYVKKCGLRQENRVMRTVWKRAGELRPTDFKKRWKEYLVIPKPTYRADIREVKVRMKKNGWSEEEIELALSADSRRGAVEAVANKLPTRTLEAIYHVRSRAKHGGVKPGYKTYPLTPEFAELLGWYVSEGNISDGAVMFSLGKHEAENVERIVQLAEAIGHRARKYEAETATRVILCSRGLARFLAEEFGANSYGKRVPAFIFSSTPETKWAFIAGVAKGDGFRDRGRDRAVEYYRIKSASELLIKQIQALLLSMNIVAGAYRIEPTPSRIGGRAIRSRGSHYEIRIPLNMRGKRGYLEDEKFIYVPISDVNVVDYRGYVYNLETSDHTFNAPFIVHNCGEREFEIYFPTSEGIKYGWLVDSTTEYTLDPHYFIPNSGYVERWTFGRYWVKWWMLRFTYEAYSSGTITIRAAAKLTSHENMLRFLKYMEPLAKALGITIPLKRPKPMVVYSQVIAECPICRAKLLRKDDQIVRVGTWGQVPSHKCPILG